MKIFIFHYLAKVSYNYHSGGGLVIIAKDKEQAKEIIKEEKCIQIRPEDWENAEVFELKDDNASPKYWVMQDAGCC